MSVAETIMNARDRIITAARGGKPDCVPAAPYIGNYGAAFCNIPLSEYCRNAQKIAEAQLRTYEALKLDMVVAQSDNYYIAEAFGCITKQALNTPPNITKHAISCLEEVDRLRRVDPVSEGRMPVYLEAVSLLRRELGKEVAIRGCGCGPFSMAGHLLGTEDFIVEIATAEIDEDTERQEMITHLLDITSDALIAFEIAMLQAGVTVVICGDSSASPDLISPQIYKKYAYPFEKKVFTALKPYLEKYDGVSLLHICGNTLPVIDDMADTGVDVLEIDHKVNLMQAKEITRDRVCLMGNLDPVAILMQSSPEVVAEKSLQAINDAGLGGGFILGSGCEVAVQTAKENLIALRDVAHMHCYK